jgi:hypothetical protein
MIDEPPWPFLMTPRQHLQWAENARRHNRPDLPQHHDQIAHAICLLTTGSPSSSDNRRI